MGASAERGGSGDPSPFTALGVRRGIEAIAHHVLAKDALAGLHSEALRHTAVDGDCVADPAVVAQVMAVAEVIADLRRPGEAPIVEHPGEVPVGAGRFRLLDDQRAVEATADLLEAALVRVVPEGASVDRVKRWYQKVPASTASNS